MRRDPYARFAEDYDRRWASFTARTHAEVRAQLPASLADKRLLDVGCGTSTLIASILVAWPAVAAITGVDASASMLARAAAKLAATPQGGKVILLEQRGDAPDLPRIIRYRPVRQHLH